MNPRQKRMFREKLKNTGWTPLQRAEIDLASVVSSHLAYGANIDAALVKRVFRNDIYTVFVYDEETQGIPLWHLSIKRNDRRPCHDWRHLQQIKNEVCGPEYEGLELYPAETRLVDQANQYHLYVLKDRRARVPVGYDVRVVNDDVGTGAAVQRPFEIKPYDCFDGDGEGI